MQVRCPHCSQTLKLKSPVSSGIPQPTLLVKCPKCNQQFRASVRNATTHPTTTPPDLSSWDIPAPAASFRQPVPPKSYQNRPTLRTKPNLQRPLLIALAGILVCSLIAIPAVWWVLYRDGSVTAQGDPSSAANPQESIFSQILPRTLHSDSHEKIFDEFLAMQEAALEVRTSSMTMDPVQIQRQWDSRDALEIESKELLQRALALPPAPREKEIAFKARFAAFNEGGRERLKQHQSQLSDADKQTMSETFSLQNAGKRISCSLLLLGYLTGGMYETPPPDGKKEELYVREIDVLREANRWLIGIKTLQDGEAAAVPIERLADKMLAIAIDRSPLGNGFDIINRDISNRGETLTRMLSTQQMTLADRLGRMESFELAMEHFKLSQQLFAGAGSQKPEAMKRALADARKPAVTSESLRPTQPMPNAPVPETRIAQSESATQQDQSRPPGFGGQSRGRMPGGLRDRARFGMGNRQEADDWNTKPAFKTQPTSGGFGRGPGGGQSQSSPEVVFQGSESATLYFDAPSDLFNTAKEWAKTIDVGNNYKANSSNGKASLSFPWTDSMDALVKKITFATVVSVDPENRSVTIDVKD